MIPLGISVLAASALRILNPVLFLPRNIGGFIADVTVSERHIDESVITENPVETGAPISDHVYDRPPVVVITVGYSSSNPIAIVDPNYIKTVYNQFLALKRSHQPFSIVTGKRLYEDMLISRIETATDKVTENVLLMQIECRQVIIVSTEVVTVPDASQMRTPQSNSATLNRGTLSLQPSDI